MRFELTTSTLARWRSTPELHPHPVTSKMRNDCESHWVEGLWWIWKKSARGFWQID